MGIIDTSNIDATKPTTGIATTQSVRDNFSAINTAFDNVNTRTVANKAAAVLLTPVADAMLFVNGSDGGWFKGVTGSSGYSDNGGAYCGTQFIPTGGDGSSAWLRVYDSPIYSNWFGALDDDDPASAADNTNAIELAIAANSSNDIIEIPRNTKFNLLAIDLTVNEFYLRFYGNDQEDNPSFQEPGTNEQINFSNCWKQDGGGTTDVNEWRFEAPHHPGIILNAKNELTKSGTATANGKASVIFTKNGFNQYQIGQNESTNVNYWALQSYEIRLDFVIGTDDWSVNPVVGDILVGDTSGAKSIIVAITTTTITASWLKGTYVTTETLTADGTKTSTATVGTLPVHSQNHKPYRIVQNMTGGQGANTNPERALNAWHVGGVLSLEDAQGGGFGSALSQIHVVDDIETPTVGWKLDKNPTTGELRHLDSAGAEIGTAIRGTFTTSVVVADAVSGGNTVTPSQSTFYQRTIEGVTHFTIGLLNINTAGLTAGNQIFVRNLETTIKNLGNSQPQFQVKGVGITSTTGSIAAEGIANTTAMGLYQNLTTGSAILTVAAIASGTGDLFISGSYIEE